MIKRLFIRIFFTAGANDATPTAEMPQGHACNMASNFGLLRLSTTHNRGPHRLFSGTSCPDFCLDHFKRSPHTSRLTQVSVCFLRAKEPCWALTPRFLFLQRPIPNFFSSFSLPTRRPLVWSLERRRPSFTQIGSVAHPSRQTFSGTPTGNLSLSLSLLII